MKQDLKKVCQAAPRCGGCNMLEVPYEEQLIKKQKMVEKLLKQFGKVNPIVGMDEP